MKIKTEITKIHYQRNPEGKLFQFLKFCSYFDGFGSRLKNFLYDKKIIKLDTVCTNQDGKVVVSGVATVKHD